MFLDAVPTTCARRVVTILSNDPYGKLGTGSACFLKKHDLFGDPVRLFFKGEDTVKSRFGGVISLIIRLMMLIYVIIQTISLIKS